MADLEIRPTMRLITLGYITTDALLVAAIVWWVNRRDDVSLAAVVAAALLLLWPVVRHIKRQRVRCRLQEGQLRYEYGLFTTSVKSLPLANIQDVTVRRTPMQRMWGIGDLRIETAGKSGALEINNVDDPQKSADTILTSVARR